MTSGLSRSPTTPTEGPALLTDEEIEGVVFDFLRDQGSDQWWEALTYSRGPYEFTSLKPAMLTLIRAIESKVRASTLTDPEGAS
jgi:hypothetical protein